MSRLNKDEKRRLEKLALREIEEVKATHSTKRGNERESLVKQLNTKVPTEVKAKHAAMVRLEKQVKVIEDWFDRSEYQYVGAASGSYSNDWKDQPAHVEVRSAESTYGTPERVHSALATFGKETKTQEARFNELEKNFSIGLLDSEDAVALFAQLQKDLASLL